LDYPSCDFDDCEAYFPKSDLEKERKILDVLDRRTEHLGQQIQLDPKRDYPLGYAKNDTEFRALLRHLQKQDLIAYESTMHDFQVWLQPEGRQMIREPASAESPQTSTTRLPTEDVMERDISDSLLGLRSDHPDPDKVAFVVMQFGTTRAHKGVIDAIRKTLDERGIKGVRADDKEYHEDLYGNIKTYMHGCSFAVAVFERIESDDFNPNVAYEVGYMRAMGKPVCLLKDKTLETLPTDLIGKLYRPFDPQEPKKTISDQLGRWLSDHNLGNEAARTAGKSS